jgi:carboxylesterase
MSDDAVPAITFPVMKGAEPWSCEADAPNAPGALVIHGFTGNPGSMRGLAEAFAAAGFHVEMPRLPGHGTALEEMLTTSWSDWLGEAEAAYRRLVQRASKVVVAGLSMGGTLTLRIGADHPEVSGLVCVNPATQPQAPEVLDVLRGMLESGTDVMPGIGSDIADPDSKEDAYEGTPIMPLLSLVEEGLAPLADRYPSMTMPLLLLTSPQDHVVDPAASDFLASTYGGPVERVTLERSYHVATQDYDKELIFESAVAFARRVTS